MIRKERKQKERGGANSRSVPLSPFLVPREDMLVVMSRLEQSSALTWDLQPDGEDLFFLESQSAMLVVLAELIYTPGFPLPEIPCTSPVCNPPACPPFSLFLRPSYPDETGPLFTHNAELGCRISDSPPKIVSQCLLAKLSS